MDIVIEQTGISQGKIVTQGITGVVKNLTSLDIGSSASHSMTSQVTSGIGATEGYSSMSLV